MLLELTHRFAVKAKQIVERTRHTYNDGEEYQHHDGDVMVQPVDDVIVAVTAQAAGDAQG